ncbi:hypothetical protein BH09PSE4_BH09PSE4_07720 [soil metagenome]
MAKPSALTSILRRAALPGIALSFMAFFGAYAVLGPNGMLAYGDYKRQLIKKQKEYAALDHQRAVLRNRVDLLDPKHANPDFADELVRKQLNVVHPDDVIIPLNK